VKVNGEGNGILPDKIALRDPDLRYCLYLALKTAI
jgi:hypothetical protein